METVRLVHRGSRIMSPLIPSILGVAVLVLAAFSTAAPSATPLLQARWDGEMGRGQYCRLVDLAVTPGSSAAAQLIPRTPFGVVLTPGQPVFLGARLAPGLPRDGLISVVSAQPESLCSLARVLRRFSLGFLAIWALSAEVSVLFARWGTWTVLKLALAGTGWCHWKACCCCELGWYCCFLPLLAVCG